MFLSLTGGAKKTGAEANLTMAVQDEGAYIFTTGAGANYGSAAQVAAVDSGMTWLADTGTTFATATSPATLTASGKAVGAWIPSSGGNEVLLDTLAANGTYYWANITPGNVTYATTTTPTAPTTFPASSLP